MVLYGRITIRPGDRVNCLCLGRIFIRPYVNMKFDPDRCKRRSTRLKGWDYASPGYYFITICTYERERLFGDVVNGKMQLNDAGHFTEQCWKNIPKHFPYTDLDEFVIMPNHMHGIVVIRRSVGAYNHTPQRQDQSVPRGANIYSPLQMHNFIRLFRFLSRY
jgi:REP element-mobilizing transposase RayT